MAREKNPSSKGAMANKEDADAEARTVFVRNLPYSFSDAQLQEVFSEIGPVRRSFTVKEKGSEQCRGFGYVQFAVTEDAIRAVELKDGTDLLGRKVMVKPAKRRASFEERRTKRQPNGKTIGEEIKSLGATPKRSSISEKSEKQELAAAMSKNQEDDVMDGEGKLSGQKDTADPEKAASQKEQSVSEKGEKQKPDNGKFNDKEVGVDARRKKKRQLDAMDAGEYKKKRKKVEAPELIKSSGKQKVARTIILGGLVSPEMREAVLELAKKVGPVESVQSSLSSQELKGRGLEKDGCKVGAAAVVFMSVKAAAEAVTKLHQKLIGGGIVWARQLGGEGSKPKKWRVIIRNLPFNVTEEKVRELLASAGFVWEAKVPRKEDGQARGFAFASFISKANAEKAIRLMNGKLVQRRQIAVDWAVERSVYEQATDAAAKLEDRGEALPSDMEDEETASEDEEDEFTAKHASLHERLENGHDNRELPTGFDEIDLAKKVLNRVVSSSSSKEPEDDVDLGKVNGGAEKIRLQSASKTAEEEKIKQSKSRDLVKSKTADEEKMKQSKSRDLAKTVFIKNLPFDVDVDSLKKHFAMFGKVKSTFLVLHPKTKRPKGTAFLEFRTVEGAVAALAAAAGTIDNVNFAKGIMLSGRQLEVLKAVEKESAEAIEKKKLEHSVVDRRNLYLLEEGKIEGGTPAANGVSEEDMSKRRQLAKVKATKLKSPDFHVSRTRLAVNNVPKSMHEAGLKKLFIDAVISRATKQEPVIKQVKILKDEAKGAKSRGVAFVEFTEHEHALVALRVLNNNPETFGPHRRPIIGFAIENLQTLRKRQERQLGSGQKGSIDNQEASSKGKKKLQKRDEKSKRRKEQALGDGRQGSTDETEDPSAVNAQEHADPGLNAKSRGRKKSRPGVIHTEQEDLAGKKRKRNAGKMLNSFNGDLDERPPSKVQKLPTGNAKGKEANPISSENKGSSRKKADFKEHVNGGHAYDKAHGVQQKATRKTKGSKFKVEDKLEKLVAVYRDKYFSHVSGGAKENKNSTGVKVSTDFKRWFE